MVFVPIVPLSLPWAKRPNSLLALCYQMDLDGPWSSLSRDCLLPAASKICNAVGVGEGDGSIGRGDNAVGIGGGRSTLGDDAAGCGGSGGEDPKVCLCAWSRSWGTLLVLWSKDARRKIAFVVASPASRDGSIGLGGFFRSAIMSNAVCFKKSLMFTSGKLICLGKNKTVSESTSLRVEGTKHLTHR